VPDPIYKGEPYNECIAYGTVMDIVDYLENEVPINFVEPKDVGYVLQIIEGYKSETSMFYNVSPILRQTFARLNAIEKKLEPIHEVATMILERNRRGQPIVSFESFMKMFAGV
jgi:hypothetical protein